jgi:HAD superfamily hydrolase (TIGR01509 family)
VFSLFKDGVYSYRAKCFKPDRRIYETAVRQFGIQARETVFVDDLLPNVAAAQEMGFHAIRYDYNRHGDFVAALAVLGVRV